jgi:hypothetical protein
MGLFTEFLHVINFASKQHWQRRRALIYGNPKPTGLHKAMQAYDKHPTAKNRQKIEELLVNEKTAK